MSNPFATESTDTAHDEILGRIDTLRKQAERAREDADHAEGLAKFHRADAANKIRLANEYAALLT